MRVAEEPSDLLAEYRREPRGYDEAVDGDGRPRSSHAGALRALEGHDLEALAATVDEQVAGEGVCFHSAGGDQAFLIDPVPRVLDADEWDAIEAGLCQRVRALNRFVADVYADRRIVTAGVVPERVIDTAEYYEPALNGMRPPGDVWIGISGLDLVRDADGEFQVLEDNVRTPSGYSYAAAARRALAAQLDVTAAQAPRPLDDLPALLAGALEAAAPAEGRTRAALLTDGEDNAAYYEHAWAAEALGIPLLEPDDLAARDDVDVVYRRTNADRLDTPVGQMLLEPMREGRIGVVNAFGTGVADDKLTHAYVEDMIRFYLDEEPLLPSVETFDLGRPEILERAMDVFDELVIKPRGGYGGQGVAILPHAEPWDVEAVREAVLERPTAFVAQRMVMLSCHPTVIDGKLAPRHVDLRPYIFLGRDDEARVAPGGLTRVAFDAGALVVNSSQNGGAKDTWVLTG
jgi:carboxylate-amine ligase